MFLRKWRDDDGWDGYGCLSLALSAHLIFIDSNETRSEHWKMRKIKNSSRPGNKIWFFLFQQPPAGNSRWGVKNSCKCKCLKCIRKVLFDFFVWFVLFYDIFIFTWFNIQSCLAAQENAYRFRSAMEISHLLNEFKVD